MAEKQILTPDPAILITGLRDTGYELNTALADIIDNSVDANATIIDVAIRLLATGEPIVTIADNGCGMTKDELLDGMKYGSSSTRNKPATRLGKFGLGMKTASTAFCKKLSVISKANKADQFYKATWDLDKVARENTWEIDIAEEAEIEKQYLLLLNSIAKDGHGTLVVWEKVDRLSESKVLKQSTMDKKIIPSFREYASMIFHKFLDKENTAVKNITMRLNGQEIEPWDPFCLSEMRSDDSGTRLLLEANKNCTIILDNDKEQEAPFSLKGYVLPPRGDYSSPAAETNARLKNTMMGFYVYRENRMIAYADWLGTRSKEPHSTLCRIEFCFDHRLDSAFKIDVKKSRIALNPELGEWLYHWSAPVVAAAEQRYRRKTTEIINKAASDYHVNSDKNIQKHADDLISTVVSVSSEAPAADGTTKAYVKNSNTGDNPMAVKILIPSDDIPGVTVFVSDSINDGSLWCKTIKDGKHAVMLNVNHPFYQKVYVPNHKEYEAMCGLDAIFWALCESEWEQLNEERKKMWKHINRSISDKLGDLVENLDDPDV